MNSRHLPLKKGSRLAPSMRPGHACAQRLPIQCAGNQPRHRLLVSLGQGVLGEAVQAVVEGRDRVQRAVHEGHHLVHGHAVVGDLQGEEDEKPMARATWLRRACSSTRPGLSLRPISFDAVQARSRSFSLRELRRMSSMSLAEVGRPHFPPARAAGRRCSRREQPTGGPRPRCAG